MTNLSLEEILNEDPLGVFDDILVKLPYPLNKYRLKGHKKIIDNYNLAKEEILNIDPNLKENFLKQYISFTLTGKDIKIGLSIRNDYLIIWSSKKDNLKHEVQKAQNKLLIKEIYLSYSSIERRKKDYGSLGYKLFSNTDIIKIKKVIKYFLKLNK